MYLPLNSSGVKHPIAQVEGYHASHAEVIDLGTEEERAELNDPLKRLEHKEVNRRIARIEQLELANLREEKTFVCNNDAKLNRLIRGKLRIERKDAHRRSRRYMVSSVII